MNKFTIRYPNGIKRHIDRHELALLSGSLTQTGPHEFNATSLQASLEQTNGPAYLAGLFTIEFRGKRRSERLETPRAMVERLTNSGVLA